MKELEGRLEERDLEVQELTTVVEEGELEVEKLKDVYRKAEHRVKILAAELSERESEIGVDKEKA